MISLVCTEALTMTLVERLSPSLAEICGLASSNEMWQVNTRPGKRLQKTMENHHAIAG
jgi:hypothetical protein